MRVDFIDIRDTLSGIKSDIGSDCLVSFAWDGETLRVMAAKPSSEMRPWVMTFDSEGNYNIDPDVLIKQFAEGVKAYFGTPKQQADYLQDLLHKCAEK